MTDFEKELKDYVKTEHFCTHYVNGTGIIKKITVEPYAKHLIALIGFEQERRDEWIDINSCWQAHDKNVCYFDDEFRKIVNDYHSLYNK